MIRFYFKAILVLMTFGTLSSLAESHTITGDGSKMDITPPMQFEADQQAALRDKFGNAGSSVRAVVDLVKLWTPGQTLRVCFFDGPPSLRTFFKKTAEKWLDNTSLQMDFGAIPYRDCTSSSNEEIRVSFAQKGSWSFVGTDSLIPAVLQKQVSLNIETNNDSLTPAQRPLLAQTILHEVGHALGFEHEHQSPVAHCDDELNWDRIISVAETQWGWSEQQVRFNMSQFVAGPRLRTTKYDRHSIMHYTLPAWMYLRGRNSRCYTEGLRGISRLDRESVQEAYPLDPTSATRQLDDRSRMAADQLRSANLDAAHLSAAGGVIAEQLRYRKDRLRLVLKLRNERGGERAVKELNPCIGVTDSPSLRCGVAADGSLVTIEVGQN